MTRYPNPFAALSELITKAFATLGDRDNPGGRNAFVVFSPRARRRHLSTPETPRARASSTPHGAQPNARPNEKSESMHATPPHGLTVSSPDRRELAMHDDCGACRGDTPM